MKRYFNRPLFSLGLSLTGITMLCPGATQLLLPQPSIAQTTPLSQNSLAVNPTTTGTLYAQVTSYDPEMARGLYALLEAQAWLKSVSFNSGELRDAALSSTNQAIQSTQKAIQYSYTGRDPIIWSNSFLSSQRAKIPPIFQNSDQIRLQKANTALTSAKSSLRAAKPDYKGEYNGLRIKAIEFTDQASNRVQQALRYVGNPDKDPDMVKALNGLKSVEQLLQEAEADKGGHRVKALELVRQAIQETQAGLIYDRKN